MSAPLLTTKFHVPATRVRLVPRPRLWQRLAEALTREHTLILISAPAGFGKTTLLSEWIQHISLPVAWLSLDQADNDPSRLLSYLSAALQKIYPQADQTIAAALQTTSSLEVEPVLAALVNVIGSSARAGILILDDYHVIESPIVHETVTFLLDHLPPQVHLVIAGRTDPPLPLARLRARNQLAELRAADLSFTPAEAAAFLNEVMMLNLAEGEVAALAERTEGWIVGLQMAALSLQGREDRSGFVRAFTGSHRFVLDYLIEEVLDRQTASAQDFLLKTSILERMTAGSCDAVTGRKDSQAVLQQLEQANLFIVPLDDERRWYRYHHLFADLLRTRLAQALPDQVVALHSRASEWYEGADLIEEAVSHALAGKDWLRAARLIERHAARISIHKLVTLSDWIEALPDELVRTRPWLCVYRAWAHYWMGLREQVEDCLLAAEQILDRSGAATESQPSPILSESEKKHLAGHIAAIRAHYSLTGEDIPRVLEMAHKALELLPEGDDMRTETAVALGGAYWGLGDVLAAQQAFDMARLNALKTGYPSLAVPSACYVGMQQTKQARLYAACETYREALELAIEPDGKPLPVAGFPSVKLGDLYREWNNLEQASDYLIKGVELCRQLGQADVLTDGYVALARLQLTQGDLGVATATLQKADQIAHKARIDPFVRCWLDDCRVRLWLSNNNLEAAIQWMRSSHLSVSDELSYHHDLHHINLARVLVTQGLMQSSKQCLDEALVLLDRLFVAADRAGWIHEQIKILILQALAWQARDDGARALDTLACALALAEPGGYVRAFVDEGQPMNDLLRRMAARRYHIDYVTRLLSALGDDLSRMTPGLQLLLEPLTDRELEVLRLAAIGQSNEAIAQTLVISIETVKKHLKNIYGKLEVHSRVEAMNRAHELGLL